MLILATREGNFAIAKFLCEQGVEVNNQNQSGNTALHYAIGKHFYDIADLLVRFGAREDIRNKNNFTVWECMGQNINFNYWYFNDASNNIDYKKYKDCKIVLIIYIKKLWVL